MKNGTSSDFHLSVHIKTCS